MTTVLLLRRFTADYARNGVNVLVLVLIPIVFVVVAAPSLADAARLLGGAGSVAALETVTAGWAAAFLAAIAMYFQVSAARTADTRLVLAGLPTARLVLGRMLTGGLLTLLASAAALLALLVRSGISDLSRVLAGTVMFAVIYLGIGAVVGALVRDAVNGTVLVLFVWILDVFFGPTMSAADKPVTRGLPTHFVSLWMTDLPTRHGGRLGDLGWAVAWTVMATVAAFVTVATTLGARRRSRQRREPGSRREQLAATMMAGWRNWRRNPVLWVLLVVVPAVFVLLAQAITPHGRAPVVLKEAGRHVTAFLDPANMHAATMAPISAASLATLAGLFLIVDTSSGDRRLALAGMHPAALITARLSLVAVAAVVAAGASVAVTATVFDAAQWPVYATANLLVALTYGLLGGLLGPLFGRVAGVFIAFLVPFLDLGIGQSPMLRGRPSTWAHYLPGYGGTRMLIDGALTPGFDETRSLLIALAWLAAAAVGAAGIHALSARNHVAPSESTSTAVT